MQMEPYVYFHSFTKEWPTTSAQPLTISEDGVQLPVIMTQTDYGEIV